MYGVMFVHYGVKDTTTDFSNKTNFHRDTIYLDTDLVGVLF